MKLSGPLIITRLQKKLRSTSGRHLYGILGKYKQLARFEKENLSQGRTPEGKKLPKPVNVNKTILDRLDDESLRDLVKNEGRTPRVIEKRLGAEFDSLLADGFQRSNILILKHFEILYAYDVELDCLRRRATNENHIILLLPGIIINDRIPLFTETESVNHRIFTGNLIANDHIWELNHES